MVRSILFWLHLASGVLAGLVILMMSATGVILTYERQLLALEDSVYARVPDASETRLSLDALLDRAALDDFAPDRITVSADPTDAVVFAAGRDRTEYLDPYSGIAYTQHDGGLRRFLGSVRGLHRWFNATGENRDRARMITGTSNLLFLFLICSGLYLWLPKLITAATLRARLWLQPKPATSTARYFNWHHVFGIWAALPLLVIVATATVFYYSWANALVYRLAGESPPQRGGVAVADRVEAAEAPAPLLPLQTLFESATQQVDDWRSIAITLPPTASSSRVNFSIDQGNGGQPQKRHTLTLNGTTGEVAEWAPFSSQSTGRQARSWVRFLHTGEALGIVGQTVAGLASLAAVLMVWSGLLLALQRLLRYLKRRRGLARSATRLATMPLGESR